MTCRCHTPSSLVAPMFSHVADVDCLTLLKVTAVTPVFDAKVIDWANHNYSYYKFRHFHSMWSFLELLEQLACLNLHSWREKRKFCFPQNLEEPE